MKRTEAQNKQLFALLTEHGLGDNAEARAKLAKQVSEGRTTHTSELSVDECATIICHLENSLTARLEIMRRMRWRLWFAFAESKYAEFCGSIGRNGKRMPNYNAIDAYCEKHWSVRIYQMS